VSPNIILPIAFSY